MLRGYSEGRAAVAGGISTSSLDRWRLSHPEFAHACATALSFGRTVMETELYERAFAGKADPGSVRALEMIIKARDPAYRNTVRGSSDRIHQAAASMQRLAAGYDSGPFE